MSIIDLLHISAHLGHYQGDVWEKNNRKLGVSSSLQTVFTGFDFCDRINILSIRRNAHSSFVCISNRDMGSLNRVDVSTKFPVQLNGTYDNCDVEYLKLKSTKVPNVHVSLHSTCY